MSEFLVTTRISRVEKTSVWRLALREEIESSEIK